MLLDVGGDVEVACCHWSWCRRLQRATLQWATGKLHVTNYLHNTYCGSVISIIRYFFAAPKNSKLSSFLFSNYGSVPRCPLLAAPLGRPSSESMTAAVRYILWRHRIFLPQGESMVSISYRQVPEQSSVAPGAKPSSP